MALPHLKLRVRPEEIALLARRLDNFSYTEGAVAELLGLWDLSQMDAGELPNYIWRCRQNDSDLAALVLLFLLGEGLPAERVTKLLGREVPAALMQCGVLFRKSGTLYSQVVLYPCLGHYFFTDYWVTKGQAEGQVYELGTDSFVLARLTPRKGHERALDLCTGSGIHAILSASSCKSAVAVDINPRALEYTEFNAALNSVHCQTQLADLYSLLETESFDLITANPPYVPSPDAEVLVHRSAGETGEEIPERLVAGLSKHLSKGGLFSMILEYPVLKGDDYLDRLERWLGEDYGWGLALLSFGEKPVGSYINKHMGPSLDYNAKFQSYLKSYTAQGISSIDFAQVFIFREHALHSNWKVRKTTLWPIKNLADNMAAWLSGYSRYSSPDWTPDPHWRPKLSPYYKTLWRDWDHSQGTLEASEQNGLPSETLNADEAELLSHMRGQTSVAQLRDLWSSMDRDEDSFLKAFRGLGLRFALV